MSPRAGRRALLTALLAALVAAGIVLAERLAREAATGPAPPAGPIVADLATVARRTDLPKIRDRDRALLDPVERAAILAATGDPVLRAERQRWRAHPCPDPDRLRPPDRALALPSFYGDRVAWRAAARQIHAIEDAVQGLAARSVAEPDGPAADCLLDLLVRWADAGARRRFRYAEDDEQARFALAGTLSGIASGYAVVRGSLADRDPERRRVESWLATLARAIVAIPGGPGSCCNNHLYRRGLAAALVGVVADDPALLAWAAAIPAAALAEMREDGSLPRETARGGRALHYQNFARAALVPLAAALRRRGLADPGRRDRTGGRSLAEAGGFLLRGPDDRTAVAPCTDRPQDEGVATGGRFLARIELARAHGDDPALRAIARRHGPFADRTSIGAATLLVAPPLDPPARHDRHARRDLRDRGSDHDTAS